MKIENNHKDVNIFDQTLFNVHKAFGDSLEKGLRRRVRIRKDGLVLKTFDVAIFDSSENIDLFDI